MRPHVEIVYGQDLLWHPAALGGTVGQASGRRLSADEETGAGTVLAHFQTAWSRPGGYHQADTEWYVLTGQATVGDLALTSGGYLRAPAGKLTPPMNVSAGSEALIFTDHGSAEFTVSDRDWEHFVRRARTDISGQPGQLTTSSAGDLDWEPAPWEADDGTRPRSRVKVLYRQSPLVAGTSAEPMTALWRPRQAGLTPRFITAAASPRLMRCPGRSNTVTARSAPVATCTGRPVSRRRVPGSPATIRRCSWSGSAIPPSRGAPRTSASACQVARSTMTRGIRSRRSSRRACRSPHGRPTPGSRSTGLPTTRKHRSQAPGT